MPRFSARRAPPRWAMAVKPWERKPSGSESMDAIMPIRAGGATLCGMRTVLSIQSAVAYGHAGNSSAVFPLQRSGVDVWPVYTVNFSNHTGYGAWRGPLIPAADVADVVRGIDERQVLDRVDALLAGYQGSPEMGQVIVDA